MPSPSDIVRNKRPGRAVVGWKLDPDCRGGSVPDQGGIGAGMRDQLCLGIDGEQHAVGLDTPREMNRLAIAARDGERHGIIPAGGWNGLVCGRMRIAHA